jgi:hypothetical protein
MQSTNVYRRLIEKIANCFLKNIPGEVSASGVAVAAFWKCSNVLIKPKNHRWQVFNTLCFNINTNTAKQKDLF